MANTEGSVLIPLRKALTDALAQREPVTNEVSVHYAFKVGDKKRRKVWTQDGEFEMSPASMRPEKTFYNETGSFSVIFRVEGVGLSPEATAEQARVLMADAHDFVATHSNWQDGALGGIDLTSLTIDGRGYIAEAFNDKGALVEGRLPIRYTARIQ